MRHPGGYATIIEPGHLTVEIDTASCGHCQRIIFTKAGTAATVYLLSTAVPGQYREEGGAFCRVCMRPICLQCYGVGRCTPWERRLEKAEARERLRRAVSV